jgi:RNA polymerase sigma factor (sigma-70 family)
MGVATSRDTTAIVTAARSGRDLSDGELVAAVRRGDDGAFEALFGRYRGPITGYVQRMCKDHARAEDITQDVFMSALRRMRETERPIAFKPWIYEIARNACIDQFRRSQRGEEVSYDADTFAGADRARLSASDASPDDAFDAKQRLDHLRGAFGGLSETHHRILVLRELEGLSYREIGEQLGMSRPAVESTLFRARRRLTEEYDELITGRRCIRVQSIIDGAAEGTLGARDQRRLARHLSHCQPCRRHARVRGVEAPARRSLAAKVGAFLPLPFLRRRLLGDQGSSSAAGARPSGALAQWTTNASPMAEPLSGWAKTAAAVAAVAVAGAGVGVASQSGALSQALPGGGGTRAHHAARATSIPATGNSSASTAVSADHGPGTPGGPSAHQSASGRTGTGGHGNGGSSSGPAARSGSGGGSARRHVLPGGGGGGSGGPSVAGVSVPNLPGAPGLPPTGVNVPTGSINAPSTPNAPSAPSTPSVSAPTSTPSLPSAPPAPNVDVGHLLP